MIVTVHVRPDVAGAWREHRPLPQAAALARVADELGVALRPVHPGEADPRLASTFVVDVPDAAAAGRVVERLQRCDAVEAAYVKPAAELP